MVALHPELVQLSTLITIDIEFITLKEALKVKRGRGRQRTAITETLRTDMKELGCGDWVEVVALARDKKTWRLRCG